MNSFLSKGLLSFLLVQLICTKSLAFGLQTSNIKAVFKGSDVQLSCNYSTNISWWFDSVRLHRNTVIKDNQLILNISNVTTKNEGVYYCGLSWQQGKRVTLVIGDVPSKPRNVYTTSFEWVSTLHWTASAFTGGLTTSYIITVQCIKYDLDLDCLEHKNKTRTVLTGFTHIKGKVYDQSLSSVLLDPDSLYNTCVCAVNQLGHSCECIKFIRSITGGSPEKTVPGPPSDFRVVEGDSPGQGILTWKPRRIWNRIEKNKVLVIINYSKFGDPQSTTVNETILGMDGGYSIANLMPNSEYTFYAQTQFRDGSQSSNLSVPVHATLHTRYADPDRPPSDIQCEVINRKDAGESSTIAVSWKPLEKGFWNGPLTYYEIKLYFVGSRDLLFNRTVNASVTRTEITGINTSEGVKVNVVACNVDGCSGIGNTCSIEPGPTILKNPPSSVKTYIIAGCIVFTLLVIIIVSSYILIRRRRKLQDRQDNGSELPSDIPGPEDVNYDYPEGEERPAEYARVHIQQDEIPLI